MSYKYISDLHLYDPGSLEWRPQYPTLSGYVDALVDTWNTFTEPDDIVIIVGDVGTYCPKTLDAIRQLNGRLVLCVGNHDRSWGIELWHCGLFQGIHEDIMLDNVMIEHLPSKAPEGSYFIHGHHHRYDMPGMYNALASYARDTYRLNCAADLNNNQPCTLQELILNKEILLDKYKEKGLLGGN